MLRSSRRVSSVWRALVLAVAGALAVSGLTLAGATTAVASSPDDPQYTDNDIPANYPAYPYVSTGYQEPFRGQFHFSSANGWLNDVNGAFYYKGQYHLFYQNNPHTTANANDIGWGHAVSTDLVHWVQQPIGLQPGIQVPSTPVEPALLWSGSAWVDKDNVSGLKDGPDDPILMFTGTRGVSLAYSTDGAKTFRMYNNGAQLFTTDPTTSRDAKVTYDPEHHRWVMVIYWEEKHVTTDETSSIEGPRFYTSSNLLNWVPANGTIASSQLTLPWFFECPDLYQLPVDGDAANKKWVLQDGSGEYLIGTLDANSMFVQDPGTTMQHMDFARQFSATDPNALASWYASQAFNQTPTGDIIQMGWQADNKGNATATGTSGGPSWWGDLSFPVKVGLTTFPEGVRVTRTPLESALQAIRTSTQTWTGVTVTSDPASDPLRSLSADTYELTATFDVSGSSASTAFGFRLHRKADGSSGATVEYRMSDQTLYGMPLAPDGSHKVSVQILVDRGQLEVYGGGGKAVFTDNTYFDSAATSQGISLYAQNGSVRVDSLTLHRLGSIWSQAQTGVAPFGQIRAAVPTPVDGGATTPFRCVDLDVASSTLQMYKCNSNNDRATNNQAWLLRSDGTIVGYGGRCITARGTGNGAAIGVDTCAPANPAQQWKQGNYGRLVNVGSQRCLDARATFANQDPLQLYDCLGTFNQEWLGPEIVSSIQTTGPGTKYCVDFDGSGTVNTYECNYQPWQTWRLGSDGTLREQRLGNCLQAAGTANNAKVFAAACPASGGTPPTSEKWYRGANGALVNVASGRCLDADLSPVTGTYANSRQLQIYDCLGTPNQKWEMWSTV
jgi:fructan beta-fructosidase